MPFLLLKHKNVLFLCASAQQKEKNMESFFHESICRTKVNIGGELIWTQASGYPSLDLKATEKQAEALVSLKLHSVFFPLWSWVS